MPIKTLTSKLEKIALEHVHAGSSYATSIAHKVNIKTQIKHFASV